MRGGSSPDYFLVKTLILLWRDPFFLLSILSSENLIASNLRGPQRNLCWDINTESEPPSGDEK